MNGDALAARDVTDNRLAAHGIAALGAINKHIVGALDLDH
jgi:hypothetical protein